jgi:hypothetical protein
VRPRVEEDVTRSRVEACRRSLAGKVGEIGYAADIGDDAVPARVPEHSRMKRWYKRGALSARGDIAASEIGDHSDAGALGKPRRVAELQAVPGPGPMTHCLPVTTDGGYGLRGDFVFLEQALDRFCIESREFNPCELCAMQLVAGCVVQGKQGGFQALRIRQKIGAQEKRSAPQVDECGIDAVETCARHQTDVDLGRR